MAINDVSSIKPKGDRSAMDCMEEQLTDREHSKISVKLDKMKLFIALCVILLISAIATYFFYQKRKAKLEEIAKQQEVEAAAQDTPIFTDLDEMVVNLDTRGKGINFLKLKITLEIQDQQSLAVLNKLMPKVKDAFQLYLRELRPNDLYGSISLYRLRDELLIRINKILYPAKVNDILFKDVLVQ